MISKNSLRLDRFSTYQFCFAESPKEQLNAAQRGQFCMPIHRCRGAKARRSRSIQAQLGTGEACPTEEMFDAKVERQMSYSPFRGFTYYYRDQMILLLHYVQRVAWTIRADFQLSKWHQAHPELDGMYDMTLIALQSLANLMPADR